MVVVDLGGMTVCPLICYDVRFPELWRPAAVAGVDVFTVSSSWPQGRISQWRSLLVARAIENQAFVVASNRIGKDEFGTWGGDSLICNPLGDMLGEASESETETISADIGEEIVRNWKKEFPVLEDIRDELIGKIRVRRITA